MGEKEIISKKSAGSWGDHAKINKPAKHKDNPNFFQSLMFQFSKDNTSGMGAQLAYYFLLAIFPLLIFLLTLVPLFQIDQQMITQFIQDYAPSDIAGMLEGVISDVMQNSNGGLLSVGLLVTLWSASNGMTALMNAFNVAYDVEDNRNFVVAKLIGNLMFGVIRSRSAIHDNRIPSRIMGLQLLYFQLRQLFCNIRQYRRRHHSDIMVVYHWSHHHTRRPDTMAEHTGRSLHARCRRSHSLK